MFFRLTLLVLVININYTFASTNEVSKLKKVIFELAQKNQGKADPKNEIQNKIKIHVDQLIAITKNKPLDLRKDQYIGKWQQIWGAYDYSDNKRGVDPKIDPEKLYQVIFDDGYYYNVTKLLDEKTGQEKYVTLLKGVYEILPGNLIRFNLRKLTKVDALPKGKTYFDLPKLSEENALINESKILPNWLVRTFLNGGFLIEVYLDHELRVFYFFDDEDFKKPYIYIMKRIS